MEWYDFIKWLAIGYFIYRGTHGSSEKPSQKPRGQGLSKQEQRDKKKFEDFFK